MGRKPTRTSSIESGRSGWVHGTAMEPRDSQGIGARNDKVARRGWPGGKYAGAAGGLDKVWRRKQSLDDLRVERNRALLWRWVRRVLTLGLWWR